MRRYSQNLRYYASLNPWQRATLPQTDRFIESSYMLYLLQDYADAGGDVEKMVTELDALGVDLNSLAAGLDN